ncbi:thiamine-phosphate pyrophosphorylase [Rhodothalassium salexigens DSM 2132]|uniref:Thiamine-phosphate pyrophosphorylase n=1 Tax=Rhodothalassium salexigens DSM 2132 TaxID=1188247 RepID=A0A4R2PKP5_RHOSA|nr:thiamine-phosphate pyrophosphorylase [Rhodothalassium salexigens DSM 2132]
MSIYVLDRGRDGDPLDVLDRLSPGTWVILRDYDRLDRAAWARTVAARCRRRRLVLLVAGDARLALRVGAAGVHLPQGLARLGGVARLPLLISAAAHDAAAIRRAMRIGADAVLVSPVFATRSHPGAPGLGPHRLARLLARHRGARGVALVALGGISAATVRRLPPGVDGIAAIDGWSA